jgi:hypothetical protein
MWKSLAVIVAFTGCVMPPPTGYGGQPASVQAGPPAGLSCVQIVQCLAACTTGTECFQGCLASGEPAAQGSANALLACNAANAGPCDAELATCRGSDAVATVQRPEPRPTDPRQPHTTADLLPWLTGQWVGSNHQFTFHGDGRVRRAGAVAMEYGQRGETKIGCVSTLNETGTVTQEGDFLIMVFGDSDTNHCGARSTNAALTVRYQIEWIDNPYYRDRPELQLRLRDIDCTKGDMYCLDSMTRR